MDEENFESARSENLGVAGWDSYNPNNSLTGAAEGGMMGVIKKKGKFFFVSPDIYISYDGWSYRRKIRREFRLSFIEHFDHQEPRDYEIYVQDSFDHSEPPSYPILSVTDSFNHLEPPTYPTLSVSESFEHSEPPEFPDLSFTDEFSHTEPDGFVLSFTEGFDT